MSPFDTLKLLKIKYKGYDAIRRFNDITRRDNLSIVYSLKDDQIVEFMNIIFNSNTFDFQNYLTLLFKRAIYNREDISSQFAKIFDLIEDINNNVTKDIIYQALTYNITLAKNLIENIIMKMSRNKHEIQNIYDEIIYDINILVNEDFSNARELSDIKYVGPPWFSRYYDTIKILLYFLKDNKNLPDGKTREEVYEQAIIIKNYFTPFL